MPQILIADDEESVAKGIALVLQEYQPETALNKKDAIRILNDFAIDLLISDLYFPELEDGLSLIREAKEISPRTFIVVLTGYGSIDTAVQAIKAGADDYLLKGIPSNELKLKIEGYLKIADERKQLDQLRSLTEAITELHPEYELVGKSEVIQGVKNKIERASREPNVNVLIIGETGTGKEVCARMIHNLSPRKEFPFLAIDCPSIPENLFESELFGYEKGAFTDARQRKIGKIELAHQGTLFLDEIGDLPLNLQPKLLRFLETGEFYRLGGTRPIRLDTRILASTNQNLEEFIKVGKFRADLYYRLKIFTIEMPRLRDRREDIELLVEYFMKRFDTRGKKKHLITKKLINALNEYPWPGNVRELKNIIECLLMTESEEEIIKMLTKETGSSRIYPTSYVGQTLSLAYKKARKQALQEFEREYFTQLLQQENWNITEAAKKVGISREELHRKIKRLGLRR